MHLVVCRNTGFDIVVWHLALRLLYMVWLSFNLNESNAKPTWIKLCSVLTLSVLQSFAHLIHKDFKWLLFLGFVNVEFEVAPLWNWFVSDDLAVHVVIVVFANVRKLEVLDKIVNINEEKPIILND